MFSHNFEPSHFHRNSSPISSLQSQCFFLQAVAGSAEGLHARIAAARKAPRPSDLRSHLRTVRRPR